MEKGGEISLGRKKLIYGKCPVCRETLRTDRAWTYIYQNEDPADKLRKLFDEHFYQHPACVLALAGYKAPEFKDE